MACLTFQETESYKPDGEAAVSAEVVEFIVLNDLTLECVRLRSSKQIRCWMCRNRPQDQARIRAKSRCWSLASRTSNHQLSQGLRLHMSG